MKKQKKRRPPKNVRLGLYQDWLKVCKNIESLGPRFLLFHESVLSELEERKFNISFYTEEKLFRIVDVKTGLEIKIPGHFKKTNRKFVLTRMKAPAIALNELQRFIDESSIRYILES